MPDENQSERAVLFADIGESTHLYEELGNEAARALTRGCLDLMIECVTKHRGTLIKTIGDEVMASFTSADAACDAAVAIVIAAREAPSGEGRALGAHVGFHWGPVLEEAGDVFGDTVNVAARIVSLAKTDEVLTTRAVVEKLGGARQEKARQIDRCMVRGKNEMIDVYEVVWQSGGETSMVRVPFSGDLAAGCLLLSVGRVTWEVDAVHRAVSIGRSAENDIVLPDPRMSRRHARIRLRHGKFVLHDESANGTLVVTDEGRRIPLHREDLTLHGSGRLGVNPGYDDADDLPIRFRVESA
jgi:class 3 adenylate cyclase